MKTFYAVLLLGCLTLLGGSFRGCVALDQPGAIVAEAQAASFSNPKPVAILGYNQDAMEPFLTRDGKFLFFNNSNAPTVDTNLFWASRIDDLTFQLQGEIGGVNSTALDAVASMDVGSNFYFISTRSYLTTKSTIYSGMYSGGAVTGVGLVPGVSLMRLGIIDFDAEISADGNTLYFSEGVFAGGNVPRSSHIVIARRSGSRFIRDPNGKKLLRKINHGAKLNYAAATSASELEIFFTRLSDGEPSIYMANRTSTSEPFDALQRITAITGFAEAPTISPDGKSLYFHQRSPDGVFSIYRVTRP